MLEVTLGVVGAAAVADEEHHPGEEGEARRRQEEVGPLQREQGLGRQRQVEAVEDVLERGPAVADDPAEAVGAEEVAGGDRARDAVQLFGGREDLVDEAREGGAVAGEEGEEALLQERGIAGDVEGVAGHPHPVETERVVADELDLLGEAELVQEAVDRLSLAAVPDVVELGVEAKARGLKGVGIAPCVLVGLDHPDRSSPPRHQGGEGEGREPAADDQVVRTGAAHGL